MSTFTTIKTSIRDSTAMQRVLQSIPGAVIIPNATVPVKSGGFTTVEFSVRLPNSVSSAGLFGGLFRKGLRYFNVIRGGDGTLLIEVNQEQTDYREVESQIASALKQHEDVAQAFDTGQQRLREQQREEMLRRMEEDQLRLEQKQCRVTPSPIQESQPQTQRGGDAISRANMVSRAKMEAGNVLAHLDQKRQELAPASPPIPPQPTPPDPQLKQDLAVFLAQGYAKEKIMEQVDHIEQQYGIKLSGEETLEDGTIEITLRG
jgi:hypothetical protein